MAVSPLETYAFRDSTRAINLLSQDATYRTIFDNPEVGIPFETSGIASTGVKLAKINNIITVVSDQPRDSGAGNLRAGNNQETLYAESNHFMIDGDVNTQSFQNRIDLMTGLPINDLEVEIQKRFGLDLISYQSRLTQMKMGLFKGYLLDESGNVKKDLFTEFGYTRNAAISIDLTSSTEDIAAEFDSVHDHIADNSYGRLITQKPIMFVGKNVFDKYRALVADQLKYTSENIRYIAGNQMIDRLSVDVMRIHASYNGWAFVEDDVGYVVPRGVAGLFAHWYAPNVLNSAATGINKISSQQYYSMRKPNSINSGVSLYTETNPLVMCTDPRLLVKVDFTTT
jgi:hypothetical protein